MKLPPFLTEWPFGEIMVTGHRIGLYHVMVHHNAGASAEQLHERYPTLTRALLEDILAFYREHRQEVDEYVAREQTAIDEQRAMTPRKLDWDQLQQRLPALRRPE